MTGLACNSSCIWKEAPSPCCFQKRPLPAVGPSAQAHASPGGGTRSPRIPSAAPPGAGTPRSVLGLHKPLKFGQVQTCQGLQPVPGGAGTWPSALAETPERVGVSSDPETSMSLVPPLTSHVPVGNHRTPGPGSGYKWGQQLTPGCQCQEARQARLGQPDQQCRHKLLCGIPRWDAKGTGPVDSLPAPPPPSAPPSSHSLTSPEGCASHLASALLSCPPPCLSLLQLAALPAKPALLSPGSPSKAEWGALGMEALARGRGYPDGQVEPTAGRWGDRGHVQGPYTDGETEATSRGPRTDGETEATSRGPRTDEETEATSRGPRTDVETEATWGDQGHVPGTRCPHDKRQSCSPGTAPHLSPPTCPGLPHLAVSMLGEGVTMVLRRGLHFSDPSQAEIPPTNPGPRTGGLRAAMCVPRVAGRMALPTLSPSSSCLTGTEPSCSGPGACFPSSCTTRLAWQRCPPTCLLHPQLCANDGSNPEPQVQGLLFAQRGLGVAHTLSDQPAVTKLPPGPPVRARTVQGAVVEAGSGRGSTGGVGAGVPLPLACQSHAEETEQGGGLGPQASPGAFQPANPVRPPARGQLETQRPGQGATGPRTRSRSLFSQLRLIHAQDAAAARREHGSSSGQAAPLLNTRGRGAQPAGRRAAWDPCLGTGVPARSHPAPPAPAPSALTRPDSVSPGAPGRPRGGLTGQGRRPESGGAAALCAGRGLRYPALRTARAGAPAGALARSRAWGSGWGSVPGLGLWLGLGPGLGALARGWDWGSGSSSRRQRAGRGAVPPPLPSAPPSPPGGPRPPTGSEPASDRITFLGPRSPAGGPGTGGRSPSSWGDVMEEAPKLDPEGWPLPGTDGLSDFGKPFWKPGPTGELLSCGLS
ncbi:collagen alpha-1(III) chain-like [Loxodonta africana]|uniref:collagen alpha-1(III) chain-like n=1 Tax=Loxodonta africana TaxID=9785 RepID=UPI0030CB7ABF